MIHDPCKSFPNIVLMCSRQSQPWSCCRQPACELEQCSRRSSWRWCSLSSLALCVGVHTDPYTVDEDLGGIGVLVLIIFFKHQHVSLAHEVGYGPGIATTLAHAQCRRCVRIATTEFS
jgi:hypothetical protein